MSTVKKIWAGVGAGVIGLVVILVLTLSSVGCVAAQDKKLIGTGANVGQGNLREWDSLTESQKKEAHFNLTGAFVVLDHNINDVPVPPDFVDFATSVAAPTTGGP